MSRGKKANPQVLRERARDLFVYNGMTGTQISEILNVSQKTISVWKTDGNWEKLQKLNESGPNGIRTKVLEAIDNVLEGENTDIDADKLSKLNSLLKQLDRNLTIDQIFGVFKEFDKWLVKVDSKKAGEISEWHLKYLTQLAQND